MMRQAIKGDGSDGTTALKAYLLEHDEVLSQELYEFIKPSIASLGAAYIQAADRLVDFGGLGDFASTVTFAKPVTAGDPIFVFESGNGAETTGLVIDDTGGNVWTTIYDDGTVRCWSAIANATGIITISVQGSNWALRGTHGQMAGGNFEIFAIEVPARYSGFAAAGAAGIGSPATVTAGSTTITFAVDPSSQYRIVLVELAPPSPGPAVALLFTGEVHISGGHPIPGMATIEAGAASAVLLATASATVVIGRFTDASSPLTYAGNVYAPAVIKNDGFKSKIGLDVDSLQLSWSFRGDEAMVTDPDTSATILTMLQGFQQGLWAGVWVKWRRVYMPAFGDCDSLGAVSMFRGRIAPVEVDRLTAKITVNSVTEMFNRQVPQQLIEANNRSGQVGPGLPPDLNADPSHWTHFECVSGHGGTVQKIVAQQTAPTPDQVYAPGTFDLGYLLFQASPLDFFVAQVQHYEVIGGFNVFYLFKPLYVDPHGYPLSFIAFIPIPKDQDVSGAGGVELPGFPHVPLPEQAV
jgi:hypothetical protein